MRYGVISYIHYSIVLLIFILKDYLSISYLDMTTAENLG